MAGASRSLSVLVAALLAATPITCSDAFATAGAATAGAATAGAATAGAATAGATGAGRLAAQQCPGASTELVSVSSSGAHSDSFSYGISVSGDGRYVAFATAATTLTPGDTNGHWDVFVRDRATGLTQRISESSGGGQGNSDSFLPAISTDGRYVAFMSRASNLVPGDTNGTEDVLVRDLSTGVTERVSLTDSGAQGAGNSVSPAISADGRYVAFVSDATDLVPGGNNAYTDVFVRDRQSGRTEQVSVSSAGTQGSNDSRFPAISADGRYVAFVSEASNLVPGDTNAATDVFVHDRSTGVTERVSVANNGTQATGASTDLPALSADGRYVAFTSSAPNLVPHDTNHKSDVFVRDRAAGGTQQVSLASSGVEGTGNSYVPTMSADGRYVAYTSDATDLVPGDTNGVSDAFVRDRSAGRTERVSVTSGGAQAGGSSSMPSLSADGRYVAFLSGATDLVAGDTNGEDDVFLRDRGVQQGSCGGEASAVLTWTNAPTGSDHGYGYAAVRVDGNRVCFGLRWTNLATPTGADLDPASALGTVAVILFSGEPGPNANTQSAWGCVTVDPANAADLAAHPEHYAVNVRTGEFPAGAISGTLR